MIKLLIFVNTAFELYKFNSYTNTIYYFDNYIPKIAIKLIKNTWDLLLNHHQILSPLNKGNKKRLLKN